MNVVKLWMLHNNWGRRNLNAEQKAYYLGKQYELAKLEAHRPAGKGAHDGPLIKTSKRIAAEHQVGVNTTKRAAQFTRAIDVIADSVGQDAKDAILQREIKISRSEVNTLAQIAKAQPQAARHVVEQITAVKKPEEVKRIVQEASRELSRPAASNGDGTLFPILKSDPAKSIEEVQLNGGVGYVIRNVNSTPVFNRTNEMVDGQTGPGIP
jgi:hypothetical protein